MSSFSSALIRSGRSRAMVRTMRAVARAPDHPLHRSRHQLALLTEQGAVRPEDEAGAGERPAVPLDYADDEVNAVVSGPRAEELGCRSRHLDGALEQAAEI